MMAFLLVATIALAVGLGIGAVAWMGSDHGDSAMGGMDMGSSASTTTQMTGHSSSMGTMSMQLDEQSFLEQMVPHHQSAVAMAEIALKKAQHPEVRNLARDIVDSQDAEIATMEGWYRKWYGTALTPSSDGMQSADMSALDATSGDDFDRAFLAMMIPHHASAVVMADSVKLAGPRQEVGQLADEIVAAQAKEIGRMQQWRERWYPPLG